MTSSTIINLSINDYAFYWSLPELIGIEKGYYDEENLSIQVNNVTPDRAVKSKSQMYIDLQKKNLSDFYHAAEYVSLSRAAESENSSIVCYSPWNDSAINGSFGLYVANDISSPDQLTNKKIAVEASTGSYYTTIEDLESYFQINDSNLLKLGDPHERLLSTLNEETSASSLMGVYGDFALSLGLKKLMESKRRKGTLMISRNDIDIDTVKSFIRATNKSINYINDNSDNVLDFYLKKLQFIINKFDYEQQKIINKNLSSIVLPFWEPWQTYPENKYNELYSWMLERKLISPSINYSDIVNTSIF